MNTPSPLNNEAKLAQILKSMPQQYINTLLAMNETSSTLDNTSTMSSFVFLLFARIHSANDTSVFSIS